MDAKVLHEKLEKDFVLPGMTDGWAEYMGGIVDFLCPQFKERSIGLVCDFTQRVNVVRTAVFPSEPVLEAILAEGIQEGMLFLHHPSIWDMRRSPEVFHDMPRSLLEKFRERNLSIFTFHVPLDHFGKYSTTVTLAQALGFTVDAPFSPYCGGLCGVFGHGTPQTVTELRLVLEKAVGHKASLYAYGDERIVAGKVAFVAGGGNSVEVLEDVAKAGINTFVTGVTLANEYSKEAHAFAKKNRINILGGTHYSTEAFACQAMCRYFEGIGLPARFVADEPCFEDM